MESSTGPKKRGRKKIFREEVNPIESTEIVLPKKRGRKPKGGKIVEEIKHVVEKYDTVSSIILHLKCSLADLSQEEKNQTCGNILSHNFTSSLKNSELSFQVISLPPQNENNTKNDIHESIIISPPVMAEEEQQTDYNSPAADITSQLHNQANNNRRSSMCEKKIIDKLKELQANLHGNNISDQKSACFWCTCSFDTPPIYIPKFELLQIFHVYGCFCSPECSVAHLMNENIDSSCKFERYQLSNNMYGKIYNYTKSIKPAPCPFYTLDKFYGNLTITEYRNLLQTNRLIFIVDKPLTRILPELHEDKDDGFNMINNQCSSTLKIKRRIPSLMSKNEFVHEKFG